MQTTIEAPLAIVSYKKTLWAHIPTKCPRFRRPQEALLDQFNLLFVAVALCDLEEVSGFVLEASRRKHLGSLFIHDPDCTSLLPRFLEEAGLWQLRNQVIHYQQPDLPARILKAHALGAENELIAAVHCLGDKLAVMNCAFRTYRVGLSEISALSGAGAKARSFEIERDGSYIHWPDLDVHLDFESIAQLADPDRRTKVTLERIQADERFGSAISDFRKSQGLTQADIKGISERQVRRIEKGNRPKVSTLGLLANAHQMNLNEYLSEIAGRLAKA